MNTYQAKIGYARTSTVEQNLDAQIAALKAAGCGMVRTEQKSGASLDGRPELKTILGFIHPGETLVVTRIDRLARSLSDLQTIVTHLKSKGAHLAENVNVPQSWYLPGEAGYIDYPTLEEEAAASA